MVLPDHEQLPVGDLGAPLAAVRPAVLHLEPGVLVAHLLVVAELRGGLGQLGGQLVGTRSQRQRERPVLLLAGPVVAQDHPAALAAAQRYPPSAVLRRLEIGTLVAGRRRAGPEFVGAFALHQQRPGPGDLEALRAAKPRTGRVLHQEAVVHAGESQLLRCQMGVEAGQHGRHRAVLPVPLGAEAGQRASAVAPYDRAASRPVFGDEAGAGQAQQRGERAADGRRRPGQRGNRAGVVFPAGDCLVFVGGQGAQDQRGSVVAFRRFLPGSGRHVTRQVPRDHVAAAQAQQELMTEIREAVSLVRLFDQPVLRGGEIAEKQREAREHGPGLEEQVLHCLPLRRRSGRDGFPQAS